MFIQMYSDCSLDGLDNTYTREHFVPYLTSHNPSMGDFYDSSSPET